MVDIMNFASSFKQCRRKNFEAYFCKAPSGSCLLDPIKDYQIIAQVGKNYLSPKEVQHIKMANPANWNLIRDKIINVTDFILSINGVLSKVSFSELNDDFTYPDGTGVTKQSILTKSYICEMQFNVLTPINVTYFRACERKKGTPQELEQVIVMRWTKIISKNNIEELALPVVDAIKENFKNFLPSEGNYFIVSEECNGQPVREKMRFVDDKLFSYMYDIRGWSKYCNGRVESASAPEPLFKLGSEVNTKKSFSDIITDYIESNYIDSIANKFEIIKNLEVKKVNDNCVCVEYLQFFGHAGIICFIWQSNNKYYLSTEFKDYYNQVFKGDIKEHLKHLKSKKFVLINEDDFQTFKEYITGFLNLSHTSIVSNYYTSHITSNEFMTLKSYTGNQYMGVNDYLRGKNTTDFDAYLKAVFISDILSRSVVCKDIYHFRGTGLPMNVASKVKEGYVLENYNFLSTSLAAPIALDFGLSHSDTEKGFVLVFKNSAKQHGMYINNISSHRDIEYEVLYDVNYDLKFIRQLGNHCEDGNSSSEVWLCELVYAEDRGIKKYQYKKDATEKLLYTLQQNQMLMKHFYIEGVNEEEANKIVVELCRYNTNDVMIRIELLLKESIFKIEFAGNIVDSFEYSIKEKGYDYMFPYIYYVMKNNKELKTAINKSVLNSFSERFMFDLTSLFINNNFIIASQVVNKNAGFDFEGSIFGNVSSLPSFSKSVNESVFDPEINMLMPVDDVMLDQEESYTPTEVVTSEFTLVGSDLKYIPFNVDICDYGRDKIKVTIESLEYGFHKEYICPFNKRLELYEMVFLSIIRKFNLDCTRRLKRIFSIISGFKQKEIKFHKRDNNEYVCYLWGKMFECVMQGSSILISLDEKSVTLDYFANVYDSASLIYTII